MTKKRRVLQKAVLSAFGITIVWKLCKKLMKKEYNVELARSNKFKAYYNLLNQWLVINQEGKSLEQYFINNNYKTIAIYGVGNLGKRLYEELKNSSIKVKYAIDRDTSNKLMDLEVFSVEDVLEDVDVIVVTPVFAFEEIEFEINSNYDFPIVSLGDIIEKLS